MNIKTLLTTTAIAAMAATAANATTTVVAGDVDGTASNSVNATAVLANELNLNPVGGAPLTGIYEFLVSTTGFMPSGNNLLSITLPAGITWSGNVTQDATGVVAGSAIFGDGATTTTDNFTGAFVSTGGIAGTSAVTIGFTSAAVTQKELKLRLNVRVDNLACATPGKVNVNLTTAAGLAIEGGTAASTTNFTKCQDAIKLVNAADANDSLLALPNFTSFVTPVASSVGDASGTVAVLGTIAPAFAGPVAIDTTVGKVLPAGATVTPIAATDISKVSFSVTLGDATGINKVQIKNGAAAQTTDGTVNSGNANQFDFAITSASGTAGTDIAELLDATADPIQVTVTGTGASVASQSISLSDVLVSYTVGTQFRSSGSTFTGVALDSLEREGTSYGPFDWVGDASKASRNLFRFTGMSANSLSMDVTFSNSSAGAASDQTVTTTLTTSNGEGQIDSVALDALNPGFGRADVTFTFFSNQTGSDVDRLILRGGVLSNFGNNAGSNGVNKGDD